MAELNDEVAIQYAVIRRNNPFASVDDVVTRIIQRLEAENVVPVDADVLWDQEEADGPTTLTMLVRNFVLAIETDPDDAAE